MFGQLVVNSAGTVQDWILSPNLNPEWSSGESIFAWYSGGETRLEEGFALSDSVPVCLNGDNRAACRISSE